MLKLKNHKYAQCGVEKNIEMYIFKSYSTDVILWNTFTNEIMCTGLYSMTTRRQISWFLKEYFPNLSYNQIRDMPKNEWFEISDL